MDRSRSVTLMCICPTGPRAMVPPMLYLDERLTMVKDTGQHLPGLPAGLPTDSTHETANGLHSAALRLLRLARTADAGMNLDGPRASALSVLVFGGPLPLG